MMSFFINPGAANFYHAVFDNDQLSLNREIIVINFVKQKQD